MTPMDSPQQQYLEDSKETECTLSSHTAISSPEIDSFKKLEYIYQHFQDIYESDPDAVRCETNNTLYPHIKDDFNCSQECYTGIQQTQQEQQLTPCTHAYDHITQHINNLDDCTQQNTLHTMEEDASIFISDTTTPVVITSLKVYKIQTPFQK